MTIVNHRIAQLACCVCGSGRRKIRGKPANHDWKVRLIACEMSHSQVPFSLGFSGNASGVES